MQWHCKSDVMNYNYSTENKGSGKSLKKCLTKIHSEMPREESRCITCTLDNVLLTADV